uniref:Uncharacterized protein n=1 Tax=Ditylenchus dipsaci TaxID=166011 RepID=A0A915DN51_9BILA
MGRSQAGNDQELFRHAAFNEESPTEEEHFAVDELLLAWARLQDLDKINEEAEMFEYMHVDDDVITDGALSLEEIVDECSKNADSQDSVNESIDIDEEEEDPVKPPVKCMEAARAMDTVRRFVEKNFADHNILKHSDALDDAIYQFRAKNLIQKKLTNFFTMI